MEEDQLRALWCQAHCGEKRSLFKGPAFQGRVVQSFRSVQDIGNFGDILHDLRIYFIVDGERVRKQTGAISAYGENAMITTPVIFPSAKKTG